MTSLDPEPGPRHFFQFSPIQIRRFLLWFIVTNLVLATAQWLYYDSNPERVIKPTTAYGFYRQGRAFEDNEQPLKAKSAYEQSLRLDPHAYKSAISLGALVFRNGDYILAEHYLRQAMPLTGNDKANLEITFYDLGLTLWREYKTKEAWDVLNKAHAMKKALDKPNFWPNDPKDPVFYVGQHDYAGFERTVKECVWPNEINKRSHQLQDWSRWHDYKHVLQDCQAYLKDNPSSRYVYFFKEYMAFAYAETGQMEKSFPLLNELEHMNLQDDELSWIKFRLIENFITLKDYTHALTMLDQMAQQHRYDDRHIQTSLAEIYHLKKDVVKERQTLENYIAAYPERKGNTWAHQRLIELACFSGDYRVAAYHLGKLWGTKELLFAVLGIILYQAVNVLMLLVFSRLFFAGNIPAIKQSPYRLRHLFLISILISLSGIFGVLAFMPLSLQFGIFDPLLMSAMVADALTLWVCLQWLLTKNKWTWPEIGFLHLGAKRLLGWSLGLLAVGLAMSEGWEFVLKKFFKMPSPNTETGELLNGFLANGAMVQKILVLIASVGLGPLAEEVFYRIFLYHFFCAFTNRPTAVILCAFAFGLAHQSMALMPYYFMLSIIFSISYIRTRSIYPAFIAHALNNFICFIAHI